MPSPTQDEEADRILGQMRVDLLLSSAMPNGSPGYPHAFESDPIGNGAQSRAKAALHRLMLKERRDELKSFNLPFRGDHSKCFDPRSCIGYQNAESDFYNEKETRIIELSSQIEGSKS